MPRPSGWTDRRSIGAWTAGKYAERVRKDVSEAQRLDITGTPTFLVGLMDGGQLKGARMIRGALPYASIKAVIDEVLSAAK